MAVNEMFRSMISNLLKSMRKMALGGERKWAMPMAASMAVTVVLIFAATAGFAGPSRRISTFFNIGRRGMDSGSVAVRKGPPVLAYFVSGTRGDCDKSTRLLTALYHPRNQYLLHLDREASDAERVKLAVFAKSHKIFRVMDNVNVVGKPDALTYMGSSSIASILHAAAILLRISGNWDWLITLSPLDYPIVTQDDLLHVLSYLPRDLNFIDHTSDLGWKEYQRAKPIMVDPGLYLSRKSAIFYATEKREMPDAYKVFTGSPWVVLSRNFMEYCVLGWDNFPRKVLMYFSNVVLATEGYFHTVICNAPEFKNTTVNSDLHYLVWDSPPKPEPHNLNLSDFKNIANSGAAFARQILQDDPVLDKIDKLLLKRSKFSFSPGGWCTKNSSRRKDSCSEWGDINSLKPTPRAKLFENLVLSLISNDTFRANQCRVQ